jgi:hypothetical protein
MILKFSLLRNDEAKMRDLMKNAKSPEIMMSKKTAERNMRKLFKSTLTAAVITSSLLALSACSNSKTNPNERNKEFAGAIPLGTGGQAAGQAKALDPRAPLFDIQGPGEVIKFVEGHTNTYFFTPHVYIDGVADYSVVQNGAPISEGATFAPATDDAHKGQIALTWTPKIGSLNGAPEKPLKINIKIVPGKVSPSTQALLAPITMSVDFLGIVLKSDSQPVIEKMDIGKSRLEMVEGDSKLFSVIVDDPAANSRNQPALTIYADGDISNDTGKVTGAQFPLQKRPDSLGNGKWRFSFAVDLSKAHVPQGANSALVSFTLTVKGASGENAADQTVVVNVTRKSQAAPAPAAPAPATTTPRNTTGGGK